MGDSRVNLSTHPMYYKPRAEVIVIRGGHIKRGEGLGSFLSAKRGDSGEGEATLGAEKNCLGLFGVNSEANTTGKVKEVVK
jgi:hypothetical protein